MNFPWYRLQSLVGSHRGLVALGAALVSVLSVLFFSNSPKRPTSAPRPANRELSSQGHFSVRRPVPSMTPVPSRLGLPATNKLVTIYAEEAAPPPAASSRVSAPFGRLIECQLVNTLESLAPNTPIIALVTEDVWFKGELIIPAGTEMHGQAQLDRVRERVVSAGSWRVVYQDGEQLTLSGIALDREFDLDGLGWGITDGSAGIRGEVMRSGSLDEIKIFLATGLSAVASGLQEQRSTPFGSYAPGSLRNAPLAASSAVLNAYAQQVLEAVKRDGLFVRVTAGKQFYVYVTEDIYQPQPGLREATATDSNNMARANLTQRR